MANKYLQIIKETNCDWLIPQKVPPGDRNSYYTFGCKFERNDLSWQDFRLKYVENGGDGIYASWALLYKEDSIGEVLKIQKSLGLEGRMNVEDGQCPVAENPATINAVHYQSERRS